MSKENIYKQAIDEWGIELQLGMMIEECSELTRAIIRFWRYPKELGNLIEEIADVKIMIRQMEEICGKEQIDGAVKAKLKRLKGMLKKGQLNQSNPNKR